MKKKWILAGLLVMAILLVSTGCVVTQDKYDTVLADLTQAEQEIQSLNPRLDTSQTKVVELISELGAVQNKNMELTANLTKTQTELDSAKALNQEVTSNLEKSQNELQTAKSEYSSFKDTTKQLWNSLNPYLDLNDTVLGIIYSIFDDNLDDVEIGCNLATAQITALNDAELQALWSQAYIVSDEDWNLYIDPFNNFLENLAQKIKTKAGALSTRLNQ